MIEQLLQYLQKEMQTNIKIKNVYYNNPFFYKTINSLATYLVVKSKDVPDEEIVIKILIDLCYNLQNNFEQEFKKF
jgi:hypothetical protein